MARVLVERLGVRVDPPHRRREPTVRAHLPDARREAGGAAASTWPSPPTAPPCGAWPATWRRPGCSRVNVSLDSLRARPLHRAHPPRRAPPRARRASTPPSAAGLAPVKLNVVVLQGVNDDEVVELARLRAGPGRPRAVHRVHAARRRRQLGRATRSCRRRRSSPRIGAVFPLEADRAAGPRARPSGSGTSTGGGEIGVIPSGDRAVLRVAATGSASPPTASCAAACFSLDELDLPGLLPRGGGHRRRARRPRSRRACTRAKWAGHAIEPGAVHPARPVDVPDRRVVRPGASGSGASRPTG